MDDRTKKMITMHETLHKDDFTRLIFFYEVLNRVLEY